MKKTLTCFLLFVAAFVSLDRLYHRDLHRFTLSKVLSFMPRHAAWDLPVMDALEKEEIQKLLQQEFTYFNKGSQAYVFLSADGNYVLKLFKQHKLRPMNWIASLMRLLPEQHYKYKYKKRKFREALMSCKNAFIGFKKDTGLMYLHLNKTHDLCQLVTCIDERGAKIQVPIDDTVFMLQKRADLIYPTVARYMKEGNVNGAKMLITSVIDLLKRLDAAGVYGNDAVLKKNFGIIEEKAAQIDVGKFRVNPHKPFREDIPRITSDFKIWVDLHYQELSEHFKEQLIQK